MKDINWSLLDWDLLKNEMPNMYAPLPKLKLTKKQFEDYCNAGLDSKLVEVLDDDE